MNEREQMLFISTDEGSSFQRQSVSFSPDTLLFHPQDQDKLLAYCREGRVGSWEVLLRDPWREEGGAPAAAPLTLSSLLLLQLFASVDLGHRWTLLQERVSKDRVYWSVLLLTGFRVVGRLRRGWDLIGSSLTSANKQ